MPLSRWARVVLPLACAIFSRKVYSGGLTSFGFHLYTSDPNIQKNIDVGLSQQQPQRSSSRKCSGSVTRPFTRWTGVRRSVNDELHTDCCYLQCCGTQETRGDDGFPHFRVGAVHLVGRGQGSTLILTHWPFYSCQSEDYTRSNSNY